MTIPQELQRILDPNPKKPSGGRSVSRAPVQALLDTLTHGAPMADFLEGIPEVTEEQATAVVKWEQNHARRTFGLELAG